MITVCLPTSLDDGVPKRVCVTLSYLSQKSEERIIPLISVTVIVRSRVFPSLSLNSPAGNLNENGPPGTALRLVIFITTTGGGSTTGVGVTSCVGVGDKVNLVTILLVDLTAKVVGEIDIIGVGTGVLASTTDTVADTVGVKLDTSGAGEEAELVTTLVVDLTADVVDITDVGTGVLVSSTDTVADTVGVKLDTSGAGEEAELVTTLVVDLTADVVDITDVGTGVLVSTTDTVAETVGVKLDTSGAGEEAELVNILVVDLTADVLDKIEIIDVGKGVLVSTTDTVADAVGVKLDTSGGGEEAELVTTLVVDLTADVVDITDVGTGVLVSTTDTVADTVAETVGVKLDTSGGGEEAELVNILVVDLTADIVDKIETIDVGTGVLISTTDTVAVGVGLTEDCNTTVITTVKLVLCPLLSVATMTTVWIPTSPDDGVPKRVCVALSNLSQKSEGKTLPFTSVIVIVRFRVFPSLSPNSPGGNLNENA